MLITVINPNTTESMTALIGDCARGAVGSGVRVEAVNPEMGPVSIESHYDEALAVPGLLQEIDRAQQRGADGFVIACFGDPGLDAAREIAVGPVVGIAEAAMHAASFLGRSFAVVTTLSRTVGRAWDLAHHYGFGRQCIAVRACEVPVLELEDPESGARQMILDECRAAVADGADSLVLGCAGMADLAAQLSIELGGIPVVDGVSAATAQVEALVRQGLRTSARLEHAPPGPKPYRGLLADFTVAAATGVTVSSGLVEVG